MRRLACVVIVAGLALWGCDLLFAPPDDSSGASNGSSSTTDGTTSDTSNGTTGDGAGLQTSGINSADGPGAHVPEIGEPVSVVIINRSGIAADVHVQFLVGDVEVRRTDLRVPADCTMDPIGPDLAVRIEINGRFVTGEATPKVTWLLTKDFVASDVLEYILAGPDETTDACPDDPDKTEPGICGCGVPDTDSDGDGAPDCVDKCPSDPNKTAPGACGCGKPETDSDGDRVPDCIDKCPSDPHKTAPGVCGCGAADTDSDGDGVANCKDLCPNDPAKSNPGVCGCGASDTDSDGDGTPDCTDNCPNDPAKTSPGVCGCGVRDSDDNNNGVIDCLEVPPPGVLVVDGDAQAGGDGESWVKAFKSLQSALTKAAASPVWNEIWVAEGTYKPDDGSGIRASSFQLQTGVTVYGGFKGDETQRNQRNVAGHPTILSGDLAGNDGPNFANYAENSYHVVTASGTNPTAVLDGFIIEAGNASGAVGVPGSDVGAGIWTSSSSPNLNNLVIRNCHAAYGSGMYNSGGSPTLTNCTFSGNSANSSGGGIYNSGGSPSLTNCTFSGNSAGSGGGIYNDSSLTLINCTFSGNSAGSGGGMFNSGGSPTLTNCTFSWNSAGSGGGMHNSTSNPTLANCILWANAVSQIFGSATVTYSCIKGNWPGTGNINNNPKFVNAAGGDLRLQSGSPCIDKGDNGAVPPAVTTDLDGNPRFADGDANGSAVVDMGAFERPNAP